MADLATLTFKQGEACLNIQFTITEGGSPFDVSAATISMSVAPQTALGVPTFTKVDADFDKTNAASGIILVDLSADNLATAGSYSGDIKFLFAANNIRKTETFKVVIEDAITD